MSAAGNRVHDTRASTTAVMTAVPTERDNPSPSAPTTPVEMTRFETASSAPAARTSIMDVRGPGASIMEAVPNERDNLSPSAPAETTSAELISAPALAAKGIASSDTLSALAAAHRDVTRALGLVLATPGVPEALRAAGRLDGARRVLHRHLEIARGEP